MAISFSSPEFRISAGTETLNSLYEWAQVSGHATKILLDDSDPSVAMIYSVEGNFRIRVMTTGIFNMEEHDHLVFKITSNTEILRIEGIMNVEKNCRITGDDNISHAATINIDGNIHCYGEEDEEVVIEKYRYLRFRHRQDIENGIGSQWDHVILTNFFGITTNTAILDFGSAYFYISKKVSLNNITIEGDAIGQFRFGGNLSDVVFNNIKVHNSYRVFTGGFVAKFSNSTFDEIEGYPFALTSMTLPTYYHSDRTSTFSFPDRGLLYQPKITFENCEFGRGNIRDTTYCAFYMYDCLIKFKDCIFRDASRGIYSYFRTSILLEGNNQFIGFSPASRARAAMRGSFYWVKSLNLTITDLSGNPIQGAIIYVNQSQGYERHTLISDENGQVKDLYGDDPVFVEKEETAFDVYNNWSDSIAAGRYHEIVITKEGYQPWVKKVEFTNNITITAALQPVIGPRHILQ